MTQTNLGTLLIDGLILIMLLHLSFEVYAGYYQGIAVQKVYFNFLAAWVILLLLTCLKLFLIDSNPFTERLLGVRNNLLYMLPFLYAPLFFKSEDSIANIVRLLLSLSLVLVFFSIAQFYLGFQLPKSLLVLRGEEVFSFYQTTIVRPTALLGNTIIFASFTLIIFALYLAKYYYVGRKRYLLILAVVGFSNILTLTRASITGLAIVIVVCFFLYYLKPTLLFVLRFTGLVLLMAVIVWGTIRSFEDTFFVQRLTGEEVTSQGSTAVHYQQLEESTNYFKTNYLAGAGVGSQGASGNPATKIITDGFWMQIIVENGVVLGILYILFHVAAALFALRAFFKSDSLQLRQLSMAFVAFSAYFFAASILNSGFAGRANFISYWLLFGVLLAQYIIVQKSRHALPRP
ncbi:hypothetical protein [uncultured Pontibacter sp.]|uniref:O-antigen ligase family protein n=1 Tax=uncultured Pontibacter sp. TaxID=453356 RepID=UPI002622220C|nr:hypothetical protein [uncultured Pontibacter sp.]